jgi:hypothetical protein
MIFFGFTHPLFFRWVYAPITFSLGLHTRYLSLGFMHPLSSLGFMHPILFSLGLRTRYLFSLGLRTRCFSLWVYAPVIFIWVYAPTYQFLLLSVYNTDPVYKNLQHDYVQGNHKRKPQLASRLK